MFYGIRARIPKTLKSPYSPFCCPCSFSPFFSILLTTIYSSMDPKNHPTIIVNNIRDFIPFTLEMENGQYTSWAELFHIHYRAFQVGNHIDSDFKPPSSSPSSAQLLRLRKPKLLLNMKHGHALTPSSSNGYMGPFQMIFYTPFWNLTPLHRKLGLPLKTFFKTIKAPELSTLTVNSSPWDLITIPTSLLIVKLWRC